VLPSPENMLAKGTLRMCDSNNSRASLGCDLINFDQRQARPIKATLFLYRFNWAFRPGPGYLSDSAGRSIEPRVLVTSREIEAPWT
jgi:hypothetical protein